jgi:hypothetical protein
MAPLCVLSQFLDGHLSCLGAGASPGSNTGNSGNLGTPVVTQAAEATSVVGSASVRSGVSLSATSAGCVGTVQLPYNYIQTIS